jgi:hypothetical protein
MREWGHRKIALAERLANGDCGGGYGEAILIISSLLSGMGVDLWPGDQRDRKRFVQLWSTYADPSLQPNRVSLPLLIDHFDARSEYSTADGLRNLRPGCFMPRGLPDVLVVTGDRVDLAELDISRVVPIDLPTLRKFSYGSVFYEHFRSGYVHTYQVGSHGDEVVLSTTRGAITYTNSVKKPHRRINFDISWIAQVAKSIWASAENDFYARTALPDPAEWWLFAKA